MSDLASTPVVPRQASTVVLLRDRAEGGIETYLIRRPYKSTFAPEAHVFPGGVIDAADSDAAVLAHTPGFDPAAFLDRLRLADDTASRALCAGYHVGAVREVFEESGILIGADAAGAPLTMQDSSRLAQARVEMLAGRSFAEILGEYRLRILPETLAYIAHFVTPLGIPKRFDTRFFAVAVPADQVAAVHAGEATHGDWYAPDHLLDRHRGDLDSLMPPTRIICSELARHGSVRSVLDDLGSRPVARIEFMARAVFARELPDRLPAPGESFAS